MATSNVAYCTHQDVKDTYPNIDEFDSKTPVYGWVTESISGDTYYVAYDSGLMTYLFIDGKSQQAGNQTIGTTKVDDAAEAINATVTTFDISDYTQFTADTFIKIDNEIMYVEAATNASPDTLTVVRGVLGTTATAHDNGSDIFLHFQPSANGDNLYDSDNDFIIIKRGSSPQDNLTEVGDDFSTLLTRLRKRASRMIDSKIGYRVQDQIQKDREGNYPDVVVRMSSLQTVILSLMSHDPNSEHIVPLKAELDELVEGVISGTIIILGLQRTMDSGKGIIREVSVNANSDLRPVELDGFYAGSGYELLKVYIDSGENGVVGTTRMTVKGKSSTTLKSEVLIDSEIITGDYQSLGVNGMKIRWAGDNDAAVTTADDEYEIELFGHGLDSSTPGQVSSISMTRS